MVRAISPVALACGIVSAEPYLKTPVVIREITDAEDDLNDDPKVVRRCAIRLPESGVGSSGTYMLKGKEDAPAYSFVEGKCAQKHRETNYQDVIFADCNNTDPTQQFKLTKLDDADICGANKYCYQIANATTTVSGGGYIGTLDASDVVTLTVVSADDTADWFVLDSTKPTQLTNVLGVYKSKGLGYLYTGGTYGKDFEFCLGTCESTSGSLGKSVCACGDKKYCDLNEKCDPTATANEGGCNLMCMSHQCSKDWEAKEGALEDTCEEGKCTDTKCCSCLNDGACLAGNHCDDDGECVPDSPTPGPTPEPTPPPADCSYLSSFVPLTVLFFANW